MLSLCSISEDYCFARYDGVVHLVTAANGAPQFYKHGKVVDDAGNNVIRNESPEEAIALDDQMQTSWRAHPRHVVVPNGSSFERKLERASSAILEIAYEKHPQHRR